MRNTRIPSKIKIGEYTLEEILKRHTHWLRKDCEGWENMKADLSYANLSDVNLRDVNLSCANLSNTDLSDANLRNANLRDADLCFANLHYANLCYADLNHANLCSADLSYANLCYANLCYTNLYNANLNYANLSYAALCNANLDLVNLCYTNLYSADFSYANNIPYIPLACPSEGSFISWKKVDCYLVKLEIPESAKRSSATTEKCRASKAKVLGIYTLDGKETDLKSVLNTNQITVLKYTVGETVYPDSFDENRWNECSHGIHFFINKQDAINY